MKSVHVLIGCYNEGSTLLCASNDENAIKLTCDKLNAEIALCTALSAKLREFIEKWDKENPQLFDKDSEWPPVLQLPYGVKEKHLSPELVAKRKERDKKIELIKRLNDEAVANRDKKLDKAISEFKLTFSDEERRVLDTPYFAYYSVAALPLLDNVDNSAFRPW